MKKFLLICSLAITAIFSNAQSVSINTDGTTADPSAMLDVKSTTKGMLVPRMTTVQRNAIPMPANGLLVYDTDLNKFYFYNGTEWGTFSSGGGSFTLPYSQFLNTSNILFEINNQGTGSAIAATSIGGNAITAFSSSSLALVAQSANHNAIYAQAASATKSAIIAEHSGAGTGLFAKSATGNALVVNGNLLIGGGNTNPSDGAVLTSDATGQAVWKANRIAFRATLLNSNFTALPGDGVRRKLQFLSQTYDYGNGFNPSTSTSPAESDGAFTAPVNGIYHFDVKTSLSLSLQQRFTANIRMVVKRGLSTVVIGGTFTESDPTGSLPLTFSSDYELQAGDIVIVEVASYPSSTSTSATISSLNSSFTGHLIFAN